MIKNLRLILGVVGVTLIIMVLGLVVWRTKRPEPTVSQPKAVERVGVDKRRWSGGTADLKADTGANTSALSSESRPTDGHFMSTEVAGEFFVTGNGASVVNYSAGFIGEDGTCEFTITHPGPVPITDGRFSFSLANGSYTVSGVFSSTSRAAVTDKLENYFISNACESGSGGPWVVAMTLQSCNQSGETKCNNVCVNIRTDAKNCGGCGNACRSNERCAQGVCVPSTTNPGGQGRCLPPSQTHLACVNNTCVRKIGAGGNLDGCTAVGSSCGGTACPPGQTRCSGTCVNLQTDRANCGACSQACLTGQVCTAGRCVTPPACTQDSDCSEGKVCRDGSCVEPPPQEDEISACWGNMGVEGKCFDCNGDGVINILDFSCFAKRWRETISQ